MKTCLAVSLVTILSVASLPEARAGQPRGYYYRGGGCNSGAVIAGAAAGFVLGAAVASAVQPAPPVYTTTYVAPALAVYAPAPAPVVYYAPAPLPVYVAPPCPVPVAYPVCAPVVVAPCVRPGFSVSVGFGGWCR